jgi:putative DNA primase/helicase
MDASVGSSSAAGYVDFKAISSAAIGVLDTIVPLILPGGYRKGREWIVRNPTRNDCTPGSFSVNLQTGIWADFATGATGGDVIDLLAYLGDKSKLDAARMLGVMLNVPLSEGSTSSTGNICSTPAPKPTATTAAPDEAQISPSSFPPQTVQDQHGKPVFVVAGDQGPRIFNNEKRRHVYRKGGVPIQIKIMCNDGGAFSVFRVVGPDGVTGWQFRKPEGFAAVPYFVHGNPFEADCPIYWPEGEKDVETLANAGLPAFTFGGTGDGLPDGCAAYVAGRAVMILSDNDDAGRKHADAKAVAIHGVAAELRIVQFPDTADKGDVSDWIAAGHTAAELVERAGATEHWHPPAAGQDQGNTQSGDFAEPDPDQLGQDEEDLTGRVAQKLRLPHGYSFSNRGLMWADPDDPDKPAILIAGHIDIVAETRDADGTSWGVLLHWKDHDGRDHQLALPRSTLAGDGSEARRILMDGGLYIAPSQKARSLLNSFLLQVRSPNRARATQRVGWHGDSFVLPDDCVGADAREILLLQSVTAHEHSFRRKGIFEGWQQNIARYAVGNSRLVLAISAAFAGPLIGPCSAEGGGVHFKGASSTGKSTALHVAGSVWGGGDDDANGYVRSWRATSNGLEGVSLGHSDTLLCLDELSQLDAKDAGQAAYMLANGAGKSRSSRDGSARKAAKWRVLFLSSGEIGLADKVAEDGRGRRLAAGQQVRIVDIPADAGAGMGMFENLHGFASPETLARHLRTATQQHYGVAARQYLAKIVPIIDDLRKQIPPIVKSFIEQYVPAGADGQVERVAQRFALIAVGGELAQQHGILPWLAGEAIAAAGKCFEAWLAARGGHDAAEARDGIEQVRSFLLANGMARFIPAWDAENKENRNQPRDVAGYRRKVADGWDYFVTTSAWKEEVCRGLDSRRLAATLAQRGYVVVADATHVAKSVRVPDHGQLRLYHIRSSFLEDE